MVHCLDRLRYTAVDALIRLSNTAPKKRMSTIFLILNLTHIVLVCPFHTVPTIVLSSCYVGFPLQLRI